MAWRKKQQQQQDSTQVSGRARDENCVHCGAKNACGAAGVALTGKKTRQVV
jgi:hypothetical protein